MNGGTSETVDVAQPRAETRPSIGGEPNQLLLESHSLFILAVPGGPEFSGSTSLLDLFGYVGLFPATVLILRVVVAVLRDGAGQSRSHVG